MEGHKLFRIGLAFVGAAVGLKGSSVVSGPDLNVAESKVTPHSSPAGSCVGDIDCGGQAVSCMRDSDCNPGVAHPDRWTSKCAGAEEAEQAQSDGGNMTGTCTPRP